jgi:hypothetical protein
MSGRAIRLDGRIAADEVTREICDPEERTPEEKLAAARQAKQAYDAAMMQIAKSPNPVAALENLRPELDALRELAMPVLDHAQQPAMHTDGRECYVQLPDGRLRRMLNSDLEEPGRWLDVTVSGDGVHTYIDKQQLFASVPAPPGVPKNAAALVADLKLAFGNKDAKEAVRQARNGQLVECRKCGRRRRKNAGRCADCGSVQTSPVFVPATTQEGST